MSVKTRVLAITPTLSDFQLRSEKNISDGSSFSAHYIVEGGVGGYLKAVSHFPVCGHPFPKHGDTKAKVDIDVIVDPDIVLSRDGLTNQGMCRLAIVVVIICTKQLKVLLCANNNYRGLNAFEHN